MLQRLLSKWFQSPEKVETRGQSAELLKAERAKRAAEKLVFERLSSGWPIPNWEELGKLEPEKGKHKFWSELSEAWVDCVSAFLGHPYDVYLSDHFILVSPIDKHSSVTLVKWLERSKATIAKFLGDIGDQDFHGKCPVFLFDSEDKYYEYISHYYPDGEHSTSGGIYLNSGYGHFALPFKDYNSTESVVAHELAHALIGASEMPLWLNEGLAQLCEEQIIGTTSFDIDKVKENIEVHWNAETIQDFWSGNSFNLPTIANELSYHLSQALTYRLMKDRTTFNVFSASARADDAGEAALQQSYGFGLNDLAATFLGEGDWSYQKKAPSQGTGQDQVYD